MTRSALLAVFLLTGCDALFGDPAARGACASSAACPAGQYCDLAGGGVCWPDATPPSLSEVTATCSTTPCARDAVLSVRARASDAEELAQVRVVLDLPGGQAVALRPLGGGLFGAELSLARWPFAGLARPVVATVTAVDGAERATSLAAAAVPVTRVRGAIPLVAGSGVTPTAPAIAPDGTVLVGGADAKLYLLPPGAGAMQIAPATFSAPVVQPPSIGAAAVWVAAGSRVYAVSPDGSQVLNGAGYDTTGALAGPPALSTGLDPEIAFVASGTGRLYALRAAAAADGFVGSTTAADPYSSGPVLDGDTTVLGVSAKVAPAAATLRQFFYDGALGSGFTREVGKVVTAPLALDAASAVWSGSSDLDQSAVQATTVSGTPGASIPLGASAGAGVAVLAGGDVVFCEGNTVRRHAPDGTARWATPPTLAGVGLTPMVLAGDQAAFLVPTRAGTLHALDGQGRELWSATLAAGAELREGNLFHAPGDPTGTAWFTSGDGKLHGVVVDGRLDPAAPWPKAWHDPRNSSNAATPLPP